MKYIPHILSHVIMVPEKKSQPRVHGRSSLRSSSSSRYALAALAAHLCPGRVPLAVHGRCSVARAVAKVEPLALCVCCCNCGHGAVPPLLLGCQGVGLTQPATRTRTLPCWRAHNDRPHRCAARGVAPTTGHAAHLQRVNPRFSHQSPRLSS